MPVTRVLFAEQSRKHYIKYDAIIVCRKSFYPAGEKCVKREVEPGSRKKLQKKITKVFFFCLKAKQRDKTENL